MGKAEEEHCLENVIDYCKTQKGFTKFIGHRLCGNDIERKVKESPDFVRYVQSKNTKGKNTIIGIEHFQVDHFSKELSNGKIGSKTNKYFKDLRKSENEFNEAFEKDNCISDVEALNFAKLATTSLHNRFSATYGSYYQSFAYSLNKHLSKVDEYISNLNQISQGTYTIELAFLIDIYSDFSDIFLTDAQGTRKSESEIAPMFQDIVKLLETVDKRKVNYIIMRFNSSRTSGENKIIALRTGNIRIQLERMKIKVYEYTGDDYYTKNHSFNRNLPYQYSHTYDGENINIELQMPSDDITIESRFHLVLQGFLMSIELKQKNCNYVTSMLVQMMMYVYGDYCLTLMKQGIPITRNVIQLINIQEKEIIEKRKNEFEKIWKSQKGDGNE